MSAFTSALVAGASSIASAASVVVNYRRDTVSVALAATEGRSEFEQEDDAQVKVVGELKDWIIQASLIVIDGVQVEPERGDYIEKTIGSVVETYEVVPLGGQSWFRNHDPDGVYLRIHTSKTGIKST